MRTSVFAFVVYCLSGLTASAQEEVKVSKSNTGDIEVVISGQPTRTYFGVTENLTFKEVVVPKEDSRWLYIKVQGKNGEQLHAIHCPKKNTAVPRGIVLRVAVSQDGKFADDQNYLWVTHDGSLPPPEKEVLKGTIQIGRDVTFTSEDGKNVFRRVKK